MRDEIELLAPAGSFESLKAAVFAGADAVYVGGARFGARAYADNFDEEGLKRAIEFAHIHRKRIYLTINTLLKEDEISSQLGDFLVSPYREGLDAVIVQDLGVLSFVHENFPLLKIHASTQMGITTAYGVEALERLGVQRVILPRELSLEEIQDIRRQTQAELEIFVHGAMCYSFSGQCLMSGMIGGRSGNRGRCAGPCRLPWDLREEKSDSGRETGEKTVKAYPPETEDGTSQKRRRKKENGVCGKQARQPNGSGFLNRPGERYLLNMKDLCTLQMMSEYLEAGVSSLKIEGRMKSPEYVAGVVEIYRKYLDSYLEKGSEESHRKEELYREKKTERDSRKKEEADAGIRQKGLREKVSPDADVRQNGDEKKRTVAASDLQRLTDLYSRGSFTDGYLHRQNGRAMLALDGPAERIRETEYLRELRKKYTETEKKEKIYGIVKILKHKEASFQLKYAGTEVCVCGPVPEEAQSRPLTRETVEEKFSRMGNTCFFLETLEIFMDDNVFLDLKTMNEMRRACVEKLTEEILAKSRRSWSVKNSPPENANELFPENGVDGQGKKSGGEKAAEEELSRTKMNLTSCETEKSAGQRDAGSKEFHPVYTALISSLDQWEPVLTSEKISDIYVEEFALLPEQIPALAKAAAEHGKRLFLAMPHIFRKRAYTVWEENEGKTLEILRNTDGIGYLVRNPDECEYLLRYAPKPIIFDYTCWRMNCRAQSVWEQLGAGNALRTCVSPELNEKELLHSDVTGCEFIMYGKIPVMVTANCLKKTTVGCNRKKSGENMSDGEGEHALSLIDRKKTAFDVKTVCRYCYNLIYNSVPISLKPEEDRLWRFGFGALRCQFTTETARETADILAGMPVERRTRGHFYRGVE